MQFYDSDLNSEVEPEGFESDKEPPKEKRNDKKALLRTKTLKIYKKIIEVGEAIARPARYDLVKIRKIEVDDDDPDRIEAQQILKGDPIEFNLGAHDHGDWLNTALENMRKSEVSVIIVKKIGFDEATQNKTQASTYFVVQLIDWITVVDLDQDFNFMKKILQKGTGNERYHESDEINGEKEYFLLLTNFIVSFNIKQGENIIFSQNIENRIISAEDNLSANIFKLLKTMKKSEICECTIKTERYLELETVHEISSHINPQIETVVINIEIKDLIKIIDVFEDKLVLKKTIRKGVHTSKPENNSEIFFNYEIYDLKNGNKIYASADNDIELEDELWRDIDRLRESGRCYSCFLDELKISKLLKNSLKIIKKMEIAEVTVLDCEKCIKYGDDYDKIIKYNNNLAELKLKYIIKLYNFTEGKNAFTMTIDEKIFNGARKKEIAINQFKSGNAKKALKIFEHINSYFDIGKFLEEDQKKVQHLQISSLLNTTLCLQKAEDWKRLIAAADKILNLEPYNVKALYRKALALKNLQEYEQAIEVLEKPLNNIEANHDLKSSIDNTMIQDMNNLLKTVKSAHNNYLKKQKNMYKSMFSNTE